MSENVQQDILAEIATDAADVTWSSSTEAKGGI